MDKMLREISEILKMAKKNAILETKSPIKIRYRENGSGKRRLSLICSRVKVREELGGGGPYRISLYLDNLDQSTDQGQAPDDNPAFTFFISIQSKGLMCFSFESRDGKMIDCDISPEKLLDALRELE